MKTLARLSFVSLSPSIAISRLNAASAAPAITLDTTHAVGLLSTILLADLVVVVAALRNL